MRVLVCGSRDWDDYVTVFAFLWGVHYWDPISCIIEGGARGADAQAAKFAINNLALEGGHEQYPADWETHGKAAGPIRNKQMLDEGRPDRVVAFKDNFDWTLRRGGTENMVKQAKAAGVPVVVISHG